MKKSISVFFAFLLLAGYSCKEEIDYAKEEKAILAVMEEETAAFYASDFERWSSTHLMDSTVARISSSKFGTRLVLGWEAISANIKPSIESKKDLITEVKKVHRMKIYEESAWVVFDNLYLDNTGKPLTDKQVVTNIFEKRNGSWRIVIRNVISAGGYYEADNMILVAINYAKSLGKKPEEYAVFFGDQLKTTWNSGLGYNGFVTGTISNWRNVVPQENITIVERDNNHVVFTATGIFPGLKKAAQFDVTYDEYLAVIRILNERIADHMGAVYSQEATPDGVKVTITKK